MARKDRIPEELNHWDFSDTKEEPNGYDTTHVPVMSDDNFKFLVSEHNKLVLFVKGLEEQIEDVERKSRR